MLFPVSEITLIFILLALSIAFITLIDFPLVEIAIKVSSFIPIDSICLEKIVSKLKSFACAVIKALSVANEIAASPSRSISV